MENNKAEILVEINKKKQELLDLRFTNAKHDLKDVSKFKKIRKEIARLNTKLKER